MYTKLSTVLKYINGRIRDSFTFAENKLNSDLQTVELQFPPITKKNKTCNLRPTKNALVLD